MVRAVNPSRKYDATRRQEQARLTRRAVLAVAHEMFVTDGYAATTMSAVAEAAGVSVETVYKTIGNKAQLVKACFDVAVAGDDEDVPMMERDDGIVAANRAEPDPRKKLAMFGTHIAESMRNTGPIQLAVRAAAATDPAAAAVWAQMGQEKLIGMTFFAAELKQSKHLRRGVSEDDARDILWTYLSVELWDLLVGDRGWDEERFGDWVGEQLIAALL
jgi:AcrR family transcriptional regulator